MVNQFIPPTYIVTPQEERRYLMSRAYIEMRHRYECCPRRTAEADMIACEEPL